MSDDESKIKCTEEEKFYSGDDELDAQIINWLKWDKNKKTRKEIKKLIEHKEWKILRERLLNRIILGTSGFRAAMRAGFDSMNDLVVIQTAQGLAEYLLEQFKNGKERQERGIVIGFDGRYNSKRFAQLSATIFANKGFKVYLYGCLVGTPFVPFAILKYKALAGVMVTASHNPREDNGYKVFSSNGAIILPPHDKNIQQMILKKLEPEAESWNLDVLNEHPLVQNPYKDMLKEYYNELIGNIPPVFLQANDCSQLRIVYSAMHGVGYRFVEHAFYVAKLNAPVAVPEQREPNPDFPTVAFPNPEKGKSALKLSIELAEKEHITTILANDPDADRLACAEKTRSGRWKVFTGNELGALLGYWAVQTYKQLSPRADLTRCYLIASTVSSKFLRSMAIAEGMNFVDTLTGFRWMANKALDLQRAGKTVLFAFEESIGYMFFTNVLDKDGITAATHLATMANYLRGEKNQTLTEKLDELYKMYGFHCTRESYLICNDAEGIDKIFNCLRTWDNDQTATYPKTLRKGLYVVENVRDLTTGLDTSMPNGRAILPVSATTQMITFTFTNGAVITIRNNGYDTLIKYYAEICGKPEDEDWDLLCDTVDDMIEAVIEEFLKPEENNLLPKTD